MVRLWAMGWIEQFGKATEHQHNLFDAFFHRVLTISTVDNLSTVQNESAGSEPPAEIAWDGTLEGETIELKEDEE